MCSYTGNWLYAYHSLLEAPLDIEALGLSLHSLLVNPGLPSGVTTFHSSDTFCWWASRSLVLCAQFFTSCEATEFARAGHRREKCPDLPVNLLMHPRASEGRGGGKAPWILKLLQKKLFFQFRWVKNKFHHFWPRPEKRFGKIPTAPPWKKTFRRPWIHHALRLECEKSKGIDSFFPKHFDTVANLSLDVVRWITTTEMKSAQV